AGWVVAAQLQAAPCGAGPRERHAGCSPGMRRLLSLGALAVSVLLAAPAGAFHTVFDYRVDRFTADGNAFGPADGVPDVVDEFDDDTLAAHWSVVAGTARGAGGLLHLTHPGVHYDVGKLIHVSDGGDTGPR